MTTILQPSLPAKRRLVRRSSKSEGGSNPSILVRGKMDCFASLAMTPLYDKQQDCNCALQFLNSRCEWAVSSPEMAHFFAQNIIAPRELFSEN
jgi:hypothetical protein